MATLERRKVLGSGQAGGTTASLSGPRLAPTRKTSTPNFQKPLKARIDPSAFVSPLLSVVRSPSTASSSSSTRPRAVAQQDRARPISSHRSTPSTPHSNSFSTVASPTQSFSSSRAPTPGSTRPPSPVRARSPERSPHHGYGQGQPTSPATPKIGERGGRSSQEAFGAMLRGGGSVVGGPPGDERRPINYLPPNVSIRAHHSPSSATSPTIPRGFSTSSSAGSATSSSPMTSPNMPSSPASFDFPSSNGFTVPSVPPVKRPRVVRKPSPTANLYGSSGEGHSLLPPNDTSDRPGPARIGSSTSSNVPSKPSQTGSLYGSSGEWHGLLPPLPPSPTHSSVSTTSRSLSPLPPHHGFLSYSPSSPNSFDSNSYRPPSAASQLRKAGPPSVSSTRHGRSHSLASSSSLTSSVHPVSDDGSFVVRAPVTSRNGHAREPDEPKPAAAAASKPSRRASDEVVEKDARVERRVLDLEIRNASLLTVNASLELLKLRQSQEIRDLRRRLRESRLLSPLTPDELPDEGLESSSSSSSEGAEDGAPHHHHRQHGGGGGERDGGGDEEAEEEVTATWEDVLLQDERFAAVAAVLESLLRRGRDAIAYRHDAVGRVLHQAEVETESKRREEEEEEEAEKLRLEDAESDESE